MLKVSDKNNLLKVFVTAVVTSAVIFLPFLILDNGLFLFYGDYNVQQIPFYKLAHEAVRSGSIWWNWNTDLGANFIGSYSFYLLGSPFFWLTIPFPTDFVPYLMAPLFILKFGVSAVTSYAFIARFTKTKEYAVFGAMLYAFSGFSIYNIFFNHFNDVIALFPLMLIALEEFIVNNRKGVFALTVGLMAVLNYFFFAGQVVFIVIYFFARSTSQDFKYNLKKFLCLAFESLLGVALAAFLMLPSYLAIADNSRISGHLTGWNMLTYENVQRYLLIFESFFFPPDIPARPNFFPDSNANWSSVAAFLPLVSMAGVIAFMLEKRRNFIKYIISICVFMAFIPFLNSAFYAFNNSYYARWFYMLILIMALASAIAFESVSSENLMRGLKRTAVVTGAFAVIGIVPSMNDDGKLEWFSMPPFPERFWAYVAIAAVCLAATAVIIKFLLRKSYLPIVLTCGVCIISVIYGILFIGTGKQHSYSYTQVVDMGLNAEFSLPESETGMYRIDVYDGMDNYPMFWKMPTIQAFHSIVPASVYEFYEGIGVERAVASRPETSHRGLRALTSVKYQFAFEGTDSEELYIPGFEYFDTQNGFDIYENKYYLPMGFVYDTYITQEDYDSLDEYDRENVMLKSVLLSEAQIRKYGNILTKTPYNEIGYMDDEEYLAECEKKSYNAISYFETNNDGFECRINIEDSHDKLLFLSVPYDEGFTAYVNGQKTDIEKVNTGFCAVKVSSGENVIKFVYRTPGLYQGMIISAAALLILIVYILLFVLLAKRDRKKFGIYKNKHLLYSEKLSSVAAKEAYVKKISSIAQTSQEPENVKSGCEKIPENKPQRDENDLNNETQQTDDES